jgi:hypothetical protein
MRWLPAEVGAGPGRGGALIEQQDLGEPVAEACPGLVSGAGDPILITPLLLIRSQDGNSAWRNR